MSFPLPNGKINHPSSQTTTRIRIMVCQLYFGIERVSFQAFGCREMRASFMPSRDVGWVESSRPTRRAVGLEDSTHPTLLQLKLKYVKPNRGPDQSFL